MVQMFNERLQYIARLKKIDQAEIASRLGIDPSTVNRWWTGKVVPREKGTRHLSELFECSFDWLATGEGPIDRYQHQPEDQVSLMTGMRTEEPPAAGPDHDTMNIDEALAMTRYVLESDTVYRGALMSNIRAFHQGVQREEEMAGVNERMADMQKTMEMMMKMLRSLGAVLPDEKRESAAGNGE